MERPRQLFRDFGLTLALLLAAVLIYWKTTLPALELNRALDQKQLELLDSQQQRRDEIERLDAKASAITDPIEIERAHREQFGSMGLPGNEVLIRMDDAAPAAPPAAAPPADRAGASAPAPAPRPGG
jgi:hypothetical protein